MRYICNKIAPHFFKFRDFVRHIVETDAKLTKLIHSSDFNSAVVVPPRKSRYGIVYLRYRLCYILRNYERNRNRYQHCTRYSGENINVQFVQRCVYSVHIVMQHQCSDSDILGDAYRTCHRECSNGCVSV